jgi:prophage regulatory protein
MVSEYDLAQYGRKIIRWPEVSDLTGIKARSTAWRKARAGEFPESVVLGENSIGWYADEIFAWIEERPRGAASVNPHGRRAVA